MFNDDVYEIKQDKVYYEQGFNINYVDALSAANDVKINNYSSIYLTNLKLDEEIFTVNELKDVQDDYITYIAYRNPGDGYLLNFDLTNSYNVNDVHSYSFVLCSEVTDISRTYFEIETLTETYCRIKRRENGKTYYLVYDGESPVSSNFYFTTSFDAADYEYPNLTRKDIFSYVLDKQGYAVFLKRFGGITYILGVDSSTIDFTLYKYDSSFNYLTEKTLFGVKLIDNLISTKPNTSWVSYNTDNLNDIKINNSKSAYNLKNNNIVHIEYNNIDNINKMSMNVMKLKNQHTRKNMSHRGNANIEGADYLPSPFFREYSTLITGNNEERGYINMGFNYVFYNQDYLVEAGKSTLLTTPSSIFPYTQLNINDSSFVKDGSLYSTTPVLADKIYKSEESLNNNLKGNYLVTWLSGSNNYPIWVDRYYFPNIATVKSALSGNPIFTPTFSNPTNQIAYDNQSSIQNEPYYDVLSNFIILPNEKYVYERVGNDFLLNYIDSFTNKVQYDFNSYINTYGNLVPVSATALEFDGNKIVSVPIDSVNRSGSFSLFFELAGNWKQNTSYIFGSLVDAGFAIYNDERVTPFLYLRNDRSVFVTNKNNTLLYSLSFDSTVLDIITENHLNDYFVTTAKNDVYKVGSDGAVKEKYTISTVVDPLTTGYVSYINYSKHGDSIYFLTTPTGEYVELNTNNGALVTGVATSFIPTTGIDFRSIYKYNNTVYAFNGDRNIVKDNTLYNLVSNITIDSYNLDISGTKEFFTTSKSVINDFNVDNDGKVYVLHNANKLAIIDKNRKLLSDNTLTPGYSGRKIDFYSDFTGGRQFYPIILMSDSFAQNYMISYTNELSTAPTQLTYITNYQQEFNYAGTFAAVYTPENDPEGGPEITSVSSVLSTTSASPTSVEDLQLFQIVGNPFGGAQTPDEQVSVDSRANNEYTTYLTLNKQQTLTNYNAYINNVSYKTLNFKLVLKNIYDTTDVTSINYTISLDSMSDYSNSLLIMYDDKEGNYDIYINGNKVFNYVVDKSKYTFNVILNNSLILGSLGFYNNVPISQFVKIPGYLYGKGYAVSNFRYFDSRLNEEQIRGIFLQNSGVGDTYITIPCDQRNNAETIKSIFKFTQPYAKSNSINLLIKNSGITNVTLQREISANIIATLSDVLPGDSDINEIKFINY